MAVNRQLQIDRGLLGGRIREQRKALGVTQEGLAKTLRVDQTTISRWEDGKIGMSVDDLGRLAHSLNKHITWFLRPREADEPLREPARLTKPDEDVATGGRRKGR
jgi:transcriptional regulator with XRE-family HTH domain